jgi:hypothetical protein
VIVGLLLVGSLCSALQIRFTSRHLRDDYRTAAAIAKHELMHGRRVLWSADPQTAMYYGLVSQADWDKAGSERFLLGDRGLSRYPGSVDVILYSKPDLYDRSGIVRSFAAGEHYHVETRLEAFEVWRPAPSGASSSSARQGVRLPRLDGTLVLDWRRK